MRRPARARQTLRLAGVCVVVPLVAAGVLLVGNRVVGQTESIADFERETRLHADVTRGCEGVVFTEDDHPCEWTVDDPVGSVVLIGDSNAGHLAEGFAMGANEAGFDATLNTLRGCPFNRLEVIQEGREDEAGPCRAFIDETVESLQKSPPDVVVVADFSERIIADESGEYRLEDPVTGEATETVAERRAAWSAGEVAMLQPLVEAGIRVIVVLPVPKFPNADVAECAPVLVVADACGGLTYSRGQVDAYRADAVAAIEVVTEQIPQVETVDFATELCDEASCSSIRDGVLLWKDGLHLSIAGAESLTPVFRDVFADG